MFHRASCRCAFLMVVLSLFSQALPPGLPTLEGLLDAHKVPTDLEEFEKVYRRLWWGARKPQVHLEGHVPLQAVSVTSSPRPSGVLRLDVMAHVLREAPLGPERDRLIVRFLDDLDQQARQADEGLPSWCLMETMANTVCYVWDVEPGPHTDKVVRLLKEYVEGEDERLRCPAACCLLGIAFRSMERQAAIVQYVEELTRAHSTAAESERSAEDPDIFTWGGVSRHLRYLKGDIWSGFCSREHVSEQKYAEMKLLSGAALFDIYKDETRPAAERRIVTALYTADASKRVEAPDEAFEYMRDHPETTGGLMASLLTPVRGGQDSDDIGDGFRRVVARAAELLVADGLNDERYTPTKGQVEGVSRPWLAELLRLAVSGRTDDKRGETMAERRRDFDWADTYCGHEGLGERLLACLEQPAPVAQRIRAATYLHYAFEGFPTAARDAHTRLTALLPNLETEYGAANKPDEARLIALVGEQIQRAAATVRDAEEAGMPEGVTGLFDLVSVVLLREGAPIEFLRELPFEWRKPVSEMVEFAERYNVGSLEEYEAIEGMVKIEEEYKGCWKLRDEKRGVTIRADEVGEDRLKVRVTYQVKGSKEEDCFYLSFRRDTKTLVQINGCAYMWPGFGLLGFHPNGELQHLTWSDDEKAYLAEFDEEGAPRECYSFKLADGMPFSK